MIPEKIIWCYGIYTPFIENLLSEFPNIILLKNLPSEEILDQYCNGTSHIALILDDLMDALEKQKQFSVNLFTRYSRHKVLSVYFLCQNQYHVSRTIQINCSHIFLLHPGRDYQNFRTLSSQMFPRAGPVLINIWKDLERNNFKYPYILLNVAPNIPYYLKILTRVFKNEDCISYIINNNR